VHVGSGSGPSNLGWEFVDLLLHFMAKEGKRSREILADMMYKCINYWVLPKSLWYHYIYKSAFHFASVKSTLSYFHIVDQVNIIVAT
jgi:hypothetical protein